MRIAIVAFVWVLYPFALAAAESSQAQQVGAPKQTNPQTSPDGGAVAQLNEAKKLAELALSQQRVVQSQMAEFAVNPVEPLAQNVGRQRQLAIETIARLQAQLADLQKSPNREARNGAVAATSTLGASQYRARSNYAQQMFEAGLNNRADGAESAAAARFKDAVQQGRQIEEMLESVRARLDQASKAAKNSPIDEPRQPREPVLERLTTLPTSPRSKASIEGVVLATDTGKPIPNATVSLARSGRFALLMAMLDDQPPPPSIDPVTTDELGRFAFRNLDADSYILNAVKTGYIQQTSQAAETGAAGTPIRLEIGRDIQDFEVSLGRLTSVTGHVRDIGGIPASGVPVQLLRPIVNARGPSTLRLVAETKSDERGEYRMKDIPPGSYVVAAGAALALTSLLQTLNSPDGEFGYTFYPGTSSADLAARLVLSGSEVKADFSLSPERRHRIRGRVIDEATGSPPIVVTANLTSIAPTGIARVNSGENSVLIRYESKNGTFEAIDLLPGTYTIQMRARGEGSRDLLGYITVVVGDSDVEGEQIVLSGTGVAAAEGKAEGK